MSKEEQVARFSTDLEALIQNYGKEFDLMAFEAAGILFCRAVQIAQRTRLPIKFVPPSPPPLTPDDGAPKDSPP
jgi:hypothetical protein